MTTPQTFSLSRDGIEHALYGWCPPKPRAVIFYVHGTQSHGGWLFETGPVLAERGVALFAQDRRGSGKSGGPRGDTPSWQAWVEDYLLGLTHAREAYPKLPLTLLGQSMGGSIAAALASDPRAPHDALILSTPALNLLHNRFDEAQLAAVMAKRDDTTLVKIPFEDEWYTEEREYLDFMKDDPLMIRQWTTRLVACAYDMETSYMQQAALKARPSAMLLSSWDEIVDNEGARAAYHALTDRQGIILELPSRAHYVEFSAARHAFRRVIASFAITGGFSA